MIYEVDAALRALITRDAATGEDVEVVFDAPGNGGYQSAGVRLAVKIVDRPVRSVISWRSTGSTEATRASLTRSGRCCPGCR